MNKTRALVEAIRSVVSLTSVNYDTGEGDLFVKVEDWSDADRGRYEEGVVAVMDHLSEWADRLEQSENRREQRERGGRG